MLLIFAGIVLVLVALVQIILDHGVRFWKDAIFWMLMVSMSVLSLMAISSCV